MTAPSFLLHVDGEDLPAECFVSRVKALRLGDPLHYATQVGPLTSESQRNKTARALDRARAQGASVLAGGHVPDGDGLQNGWYYESTVVGNVCREHDIWTEQVLGPITVLRTSHDDDDAGRPTTHSTDSPRRYGPLTPRGRFGWLKTSRSELSTEAMRYS
jgi:acyl-CoA reductase-like NAD-dependent aldehyde dehydrogenase